MTATYSVFIATMTKGFSQFYSMLKRSLFHLKWRGDLLYRLHSSQLNKRTALCQDGDLPDLASFLLHGKPLHTMGFAWPPSWTGCKGKQVHLHTITMDGRIPFQLHFRLRGERSRGAYYCGWNKFSRNGRGDGKGSPLTLIWANDTAPASYNNIPTEKCFLDDRAAVHASDSRQWIN